MIMTLQYQHLPMKLLLLPNFLLRKTLKKKQNPQCKIRIFDPTVRVFPNNFRNYSCYNIGLCSFSDKELKIGRKSYKCDNLLSLINSMGENNVDIVKMDIEGQEYSFVQNNMKEISSRVGQILIEFHAMNKYNFSTFLTKVIHPLEKVGFYMITIEPVSYAAFAFEMTFININWDPVKKISTNHEIR